MRRTYHCCERTLIAVTRVEDRSLDAVKNRRRRRSCCRGRGLGLGRLRRGPSLSLGSFLSGSGLSQSGQGLSLGSFLSSQGLSLGGLLSGSRSSSVDSCCYC